MGRSLKLLAVAALVLVPTVAAAQPAPVYAEGNPWAFHKGITFEANIGVGFMWERVSGSSGGVDVSSTSDTKVGLGGLNIAVGAWIAPNVAISGRIAGVTYSPPDQDDGMGGTISQQLTGAFIGPTVQFWLNPRLWIGGGAGLAVAGVLSSSDSNGGSVQSSSSQTGFGLDLRAGYTFAGGMASPNSWNVSVELTPGFFGAQDNTDITVQLNGFAILFGYQYL
jgi:hypothetical protein